MRFVDCFSGLGGFHLAARALGGECVFASEIDENLRLIYEKNFGLTPEGDIRCIKPTDVPPHDLLCAGFPCQPFSKAGSQIGMKDSVRGTVLSNVLHILKHHRPEFVALENVSHFIRHDDGNTYRILRKKLEKLGYEIACTELSPHQFGVPQIRQRMYLVGRRNHLEGFDWPTAETEAADLSICDVLDQNPSDPVSLSQQVVDCLNAWQKFVSRYPKDVELPSFPIWSMEFGATYPYGYDSLSRYPLNVLQWSKGAFGKRLSGRTRSEIAGRVPTYARAGRGAFPRWKKLFIEQNRELYRNNKKWISEWLPQVAHFPPSLQKLEWNCKGEERDIWKYVIQFRASGVRVKRPSTAPSLVAMTTTQVPIIAWERRFMTLRECARLQSMDSLKHLPEGTRGMKALGNAVNVTVARRVLKSLLNPRSGKKLERNGSKVAG